MEDVFGSEDDNEQDDGGRRSVCGVGLVSTYYDDDDGDD